jgi:hypothetical protein
MNPDPMIRPVLRRTAARAFYLQTAAEWMTGRKRVPAAALEAAEQAARAALVRHACQPKSHVRLPSPGSGDRPPADP